MFLKQWILNFTEIRGIGEWKDWVVLGFYTSRRSQTIRIPLLSHATKEAQKQVRQSGTWRWNPETDGDNEGTEFKETKQEKDKKGKWDKSAKGQKEEENTVKEILPDELWGDAVAFLPGHSCNVKKRSNLLAVLTRHSGSRRARYEDKQGTETQTSAQIQSPQIHRNSWEMAVSFQASQRGGFLLTSGEPTEVQEPASEGPPANEKGT